MEDDFTKRFERNFPTLDTKQQKNLRNKKVLVAGAGGIGGFVIEGLARIGVGNIDIIDCDVFEESNLNRQILSNEKNLNKSKAKQAILRIKKIDSSILCKGIAKRLDSTNIYRLAKGYDLIIDALDDIKIKIELEIASKQANTHLIHSAIGGWYGQVAHCGVDSFVLKNIYKEHKYGIEKTLGNPYFTPALVASIVVLESIKFLCEMEILNETLYFIDMKNMEIEKIKLKGDKAN